jgi:general secretion pathway protein F
MNTYEYVALNAQGKKEKGVLDADTMKMARQALRDRALIPLTVVEVSGEQSFSFRQKRVSHRDITLFTRQLATLLEAELPLAQALDGVIEQTESKSAKHVLITVRNKVAEGYALSQSMRAHPRVFSNLYCASVAAAEASGDLSKVLVSLADHLEETERLRAKVSQALIYPSFVMIISFAFTLFLMVKVVPQLLDVFMGNGQALPFPTRLLIMISATIKMIGIPFILAIIAGVIALKVALKKPAFAFQFDAWKLRLPMLGRIIRQAETARLMRTLALLLSAGVPLLDALKAAQQVVTSRPIAASMTDVMRQVQEGVSLHQSLTASRYFSPMSLHMIASGERAGKLEHMIERAAKQQETELEHVLQKALTLFEPIMILVMGGVVLFIVLAVLLPIFSATQF